MAMSGAEATQPAGGFRHDVGCRNCGAPAPALYCPSCGQETQLALPTARQFVKDAAGRYVAIDGRLWRTLAALFFRPGFLTREYLEGRRRRYVRPARLFLVLSIAMFALFRVLVDVPRLGDSDLVRFDGPQAEAPPAATAPAVPELPERTARTSSERPSTEPPQRAASATPQRGALERETQSPERQGEPARHFPSFSVDEKANVIVEGPPGIVTDALKRRAERFNAMSRDDKIEQVVLGAVRYGPYAMVVLLPVFALLLKLLYLGRSRFYPARPRRYSEHLVFAAHDLSFLFAIVMLAAVVPWGSMRSALVVWGFVYALWAMKVVYGGRWSGVLARAAVLGLSYFFLFGAIVIGLVVAAILVR